MRWEVWFRVGGVCAMLGGACWVLKSGSILTGIQPPFLFEVAPVLSAFGMVGLHARFSGGGGIPAGIGLTLAILGCGLAVVPLVSNVPTSSEDFSPVVFGAFLINFAALIFLGIATRPTGAFPAPWTSLPLAMGVDLPAYSGRRSTRVHLGTASGTSAARDRYRLDLDRVSHSGITGHRP